MSTDHTTHTPVALVTGASSGIGRHAAIRIAERGAGVILTYRSQPDGARETVARIEALGGTAVALPLDVGDVAGFPAFAARVRDELAGRWGRGTFDHLVNNAGIGGPAMFADITEERYEAFHRVLFKGPFFLTQALLPLLADDGAIVFTSSGSALHTFIEPGYSAYASMKGAIVVLTRSLAKELSPRGIRVNAVAPGPTRTGFIPDELIARQPGLVEPLVARTALGRLGDGDDVGKVIAALVADETAWITGQTIDVSGGFNM